MDLQERLALDVAREQIGKVRARTRPWRSIIAVVLALLAAAASVQARSADVLGALGRPGSLALAYGGAGAFVLFAGAATVGLGNAARRVLQPSVGSSHASVIRFVVVIIAGIVTIVVTLELLAIPVTQLLVGGALAGVVAGIAAQQSLANVFAGMVLLVARPFRVGDKVGIRSGALSGLIEGTVSEVSVTYVRLDTPKGPVYLPNSQVLAAAVGPAGAVPSPAGSPPPPPAQAPAGSPPPPPAQAPAASAGDGHPAAQPPRDSS